MSDAEDLAARWRERHGSLPPDAHRFRTAYPDRWVRFHSLPGSKRYPESPTEYAVALDRYNTVLDELFAGQDVFVVTTDWSWVGASDASPGSPTPRAALHPGGVQWWAEVDDSDPDREFHTRTRWYADRRPWRRGCVDGMLRAVADEEIVGVFVADTELSRIHHPYDGGADVVLATAAERDRTRRRHTEWLSRSASGM